MDVLNWFVNLDHESLVTTMYIVVTVLLALNLYTKNINLIVLFSSILIIGLLDLATSHKLVDYLNTPQLKKYHWLQFVYFSIFNVLIFLAIYKRKKWLTSFGLGHKYQLYLQEFGLVVIAIIGLIVQLTSMVNYFYYYAFGEYSLLIHGMYALLKTALLGLKNIALITLTIQNIFGLLNRKKQGVLNA